MFKKTNFDSFIKDLTDHELAIFIGYRFDGFLSGSREKIVNEVKKRGLTKEKLQEYYRVKLIKPLDEYSKICERCGSNRLFIETDYEQRTGGKYSGMDVEIDTLRCRLCGYNPDKELPTNLFDRIKRIFKNNKSEKIVRWEYF